MWRNSTRGTVGDHVLVPWVAGPLLPNACEKGRSGHDAGCQESRGQLDFSKHDHILPEHLPEEATQGENFSQILASLFHQY